MQQTKRRMHFSAVCALAVLAGAALVSCGGGAGSAAAPTPATTPAPVPTPDPPAPVNGPAWTSYGGDAQHTALAAIKTQDLNRIVWSTPVDVAPQYTSRGYLLVHYGSPVITSKNTVLIPVKRASANLFRVEARSGGNGTLVWSMDSDYVPPAHNWTPSYNVTLTKSNRMVTPGAGGKVLMRDDADSASASTQSAVFYGSAAYTAGKAALDTSVFINTPISADAQGNLYFGFVALAGNPAGLSSGFARIGADGAGSWDSAATLSGDATSFKPAMGNAPAVSADQKTLYVVVNGAPLDGGYLLALDAATLAVKSKVRLLDPQTGAAARISDDSTASPTVGPDGDVYIGVLESETGAHNQRGWLLHFDATLAQVKIPGSFGWDDTASVVPASMVPSYSGSSAYLVMTKYNNYGGSGSGDGKNRVAVLDPNASQPDFISGKPVMKEVLTVLGPTPDPNYPGGVDEWCINTAAIDPFSKAILVNSEDGYLYRWDMASNTLIQKIRLSSGLGESYTPTAIGADGAVVAINNAVLFSIGK